MMLSTSELFIIVSGSLAKRPLPFSWPKVVLIYLSTLGRAAAVILVLALAMLVDGTIWLGLYCVLTKFLAWKPRSFCIGTEEVKSDCPAMVFSALELSYI